MQVLVHYNCVLEFVFKAKHMKQITSEQILAIQNYLMDCISQRPIRETIAVINTLNNLEDLPTKKDT